MKSNEWLRIRAHSHCNRINMATALLDEGYEVRIIKITNNLHQTKYVIEYRNNTELDEIE
jgi:hypothetical protein